jgi:hypothetical protein
MSRAILGTRAISSLNHVVGLTLHVLLPLRNFDASNSNDVESNGG